MGNVERPSLTGWNIVKRTDMTVRTDAAGQERAAALSGGSHGEHY